MGHTQPYHEHYIQPVSGQILTDTDTGLGIWLKASFNTDQKTGQALDDYSNGLESLHTLGHHIISLSPRIVDWVTILWTRTHFFSYLTLMLVFLPCGTLDIHKAMKR